MEGWIKAERKWLDNPIIWKDADHIAVWMFLQLSATHAERQADFCGKVIVLKPGQLITGRDHIAKHTKVNSQKVERILKKLISVHLIEQQTGNKGRLISLLNWETEQESEQQNEQPVNNERTTNEHLQEYKNVRKKEDNNMSAHSKHFTPPTVAEVKEYCRKRQNSVDPERFIDYYIARGWELSKGRKMKDWKAAVRTWEKNNYDKGNQSKASGVEETASYNYRTSYF